MLPDTPTRFVAERPITVVTPVPGIGAGLAVTSTAGRSLPEFGALAEIVSDAAVTDVFVNGSGEVWADKGGGLERREKVQFDNEEEVRRLAVKLIALGGRHVDESTPCIDVRLHDGIRVHAVLPPISPQGTLLSIRIPQLQRLSIEDLVGKGFFNVVPAEPLLALISQRANILITGAGGTGKTTLLSALLAEASPSDRIIAIEDVAELQVDHAHFVSLEARQPNLEGAGEVGPARLVREALRMRPDRLVLGECRGAEVRELLSALNTGHDGGAGTLHANSLENVPARLEALGALAGLDVTAVARQAISAIDAIVHLNRENGVRHLAELGNLEVDVQGRLIARPSELELARES